MVLQKSRLIYVVGFSSLFLSILGFSLAQASSSTIYRLGELLFYSGILGMLFAAGLGIRIAIKKKSDNLKSKSDLPESSSTTEEQKGRPCNVCGTFIPKEQKVCPTCGDIYST